MLQNYGEKVKVGIINLANKHYSLDNLAFCCFILAGLFSGILSNLLYGFSVLLAIFITYLNYKFGK